MRYSIVRVVAGIILIALAVTLGGSVVWGQAEMSPEAPSAQPMEGGGNGSTEANGGTEASGNGSQDSEDSGSSWQDVVVGIAEWFGEHIIKPVGCAIGTAAYYAAKPATQFSSFGFVELNADEQLCECCRRQNEEVAYFIGQIGGTYLGHVQAAFLAGACPCWNTGAQIVTLCKQGASGTYCPEELSCANTFLIGYSAAFGWPVPGQPAGTTVFPTNPLGQIPSGIGSPWFTQACANAFPMGNASQATINATWQGGQSVSFPANHPSATLITNAAQQAGAYVIYTPPQTGQQTGSWMIIPKP